VEFLPHTKTGILRDDDIAAMRKIMDEEQFAQEMLCSFEASVRGAIYARQMETTEAEDRIGDFPLDRTSPTDVIMDLGWRDDSTIGFVQKRPSALLMGHAYHDNLRPISHYIRYIKEYWGDNKLKPGQIWLPHDARAKSLQTGKSIIENFRDADLRPKIVPSLDLLDGIAATRKTFPIWYFHKPATQDLILALKSYHRAYDEDRKIFSDEPVHDWSSHYADMFRYANIVQNPSGKPQERPDINKTLATALPTGVHYGFALDDLWDLRGAGPSQGRPYG
jgi:phage terminase large subunit